MRATVERRSKRWLQQRWLLDTVLATIGVEWDQERLSHYARPAGPAAAGVFRAAGAKMKKFQRLPSRIRRCRAPHRSARQSLRSRWPHRTGARKLHNGIASLVGAALGDRIKGLAQAFVIHEPGCFAIFNAASPTFRMRFMFMANVTDDDEFDAFAEGFDVRDQAARIKCPVLICAGEDDELSPIENTYDVFERINAPKKLVVYEGGKHSMGAASSVQLGENFGILTAEWVADRLNNVPTEPDANILVDMYGKSSTR